MSELPGTAAVGIESVEWLDAGGGNLTVQITGRWRRRRPAAGGQTALVVDAEGRRHRFPAMPEPPSLGGAAPGTWRLSFSVPGWLVPELRGRTWLAFGTVTVPLPTPDSAVTELVPGAGDAPSVAEAASVADPPPAGERAPVQTPDGVETPDAVETPPGAREPLASADEPPAEGGSQESGLEIERAWRRAEDAERASTELTERVGRLESDLQAARREHAEATAALTERDRSRRVAEQRAHAEEALRRDLARQVAAGERETARARQAMGDLAAAEERIRALEGQLGDARRAGDEAERVAAAALAVRERAERALRAAEPAEGVVGVEGDRLRFERRMRARRASGGTRVPAEPSPAPAAEAVPPALPAAVAVAPAVSSAEPDVVRALRRELDARAAAEAALRARAVQAESRLAARVLLEQRTAATLRRLRDELDELRELVERERARRQSAEGRVAELTGELGGQRERSQDAYHAIGELRGALDRLRPPPRDAPPPSTAASNPPVAASGVPAAAGPVAPERLGDALARLRETTAPKDPPPDPDPGQDAAAAPDAVATPLRAVPGRPTVERAFRRLVRLDADAAGRLLLDLLPLQRSAYPHPVSYDLVLGPGRGCIQVNVGAGEPQVELHGAGRAREQVDLRIVGDPARVARLLTAGRLRRRLGFRVARVRGRRDGLAALDALLALPLDIVALCCAGMRAEPETLLWLVAAMVVPEWTRGERFSLAHTDEGGRVVYLHVRDGRTPHVSRTAPEGRVATEIDGSPSALAEIIAGETRPPDDAPAVRGDRGPLSSLRDWVKRAQSE